MRQRGRLITILVLLLSGILLSSGGIWIHAKAMVAQFLLRQAWEQTLARQQPVKPWPWADIHPAARLLAPKYNQDLIVLDNQSGAALAFGPGILPQNGKGEQQKQKVCILAGHRDTSFRFLQQVRPGDIFILEDSSGDIRRYRTTTAAIRPAERLFFVRQPLPQLILVTCYPFNGLLPGTPQRYVVTAELI